MTTAARPGLHSAHPPAMNMQGSLTPLSVLGPQADDERQRIQQQFESGVSARETVLALCALADKDIQQVFGEVLRVHNTPSSGLCLLALGGFGRRWLFPYSDLDILFLFGNERAEAEFRPLISEFSRVLWDIGFRVSSAGRTIDECKRIEEDNAEFHLALLDRRFLAGDKALFEKLDSKVLPGSEKQARPFLMAQLQKLTKDRLTRYGNTIFHLEPNVKESPGGLRDYQATVWVQQISGEKKDARPTMTAEDELVRKAVDFMSEIRCFLHYSNGRNDNTLTYELQAAAAARSLGIPGRFSGAISGAISGSAARKKDAEVVERGAAEHDTAEWMRMYFRQARTLNRRLLRHMEQRTQLTTLSLRERIFNAARVPKLETSTIRPFIERDGLLEIVAPGALSDRSITFSLFLAAASA